MNMMEMFRGNKTKQIDGVFIFEDTNKPVPDTWKNHPCGKCGKKFTPEGHDPCLGTLPGAINACCGHGHEKGYVQFRDGHCLRGEQAEEMFEILKNSRKAMNQNNQQKTSKYLEARDHRTWITVGIGVAITIAVAFLISSI